MKCLLEMEILAGVAANIKQKFNIIFMVWLTLNHE